MTEAVTSAAHGRLARERTRQSRKSALQHERTLVPAGWRPECTDHVNASRLVREVWEGTKLHYAERAVLGGRREWRHLYAAALLEFLPAAAWAGLVDADLVVFHRSGHALSSQSSASLFDLGSFAFGEAIESGM